MAFSTKKFKEKKLRGSLGSNLKLSIKALIKDQRTENLKPSLKPFLLRKYTLCRFKNRCTVTNRAFSVYRAFGFSRIVLRERALYGSLYGIKKSSW